MAQGWIELDRCERVVVVSSDTASGPDLMQWIGSCFQALCASSIESTVEIINCYILKGGSDYHFKVLRVKLKGIIVARMVPWSNEGNSCPKIHRAQD